MSESSINGISLQRRGGSGRSWAPPNRRDVPCLCRSRVATAGLSGILRSLGTLGFADWMMCIGNGTLGERHLAAIDIIKRQLKKDRVPAVPDEIGEKKKRP
jgi:hypothetical protein